MVCAPAGSPPAVGQDHRPGPGCVLPPHPQLRHGRGYCLPACPRAPASAHHFCMVHRFFGPCTQLDAWVYVSGKQSKAKQRKAKESKGKESKGKSRAG
eukprot:1147362-Pelagomonas_calceolata.AAC.5